MKKNKIFIVALIALFILLIPYLKNNSKTALNEAEAQVMISIPKEQTIPEMINQIAPMFEQSPALINKISYCESQHKVKSHDGGRGVNITGIHDATFDWYLVLYKKKYGETLDKKSTYDQLKMMSFMFSLGEKERKLWTTYVAYKNGGTYTFYSKLLKGTYTARCK